MTDQICIVDGCEGLIKVRLRGFCNAHYLRWYRHGDPTIILTNQRPPCSIKGCDRKHSGRGFCRMHHARWKRHGDPHYDGSPPTTDEQRQDRFWSYTDVSGDCWEWTGSKTPAGYGQLYIGWVNGKRTVAYAHRWIWEQLVGPIPEGLELDHLCRNRGCVNPDHLEPVTHAENMRRSPVAQRVLVDH